MQKQKVHLLCNAHIDPIWQWEWEEGASCALSTFQSAANLLKEYDFVFNHNEMLLYKYTKEFSPELFDEIKKLVKEKKWIISGGWYNQPDVVLPCGEAIVRQIQTGKMYFMENFGQFPKTAINFDSFGHSRGLVQIIKKCGQENYIFMRPMDKMIDPNKNEYVDLPSLQFNWIGYDGSVIKAARCTSYGTGLGHAVEKINNDVTQTFANYPVVLSTWGVGNHGGGPSRKDLEDIAKMIEEKKDSIEFIHSTPDQFFDDINPTESWDKSLNRVMVGCYTSQVSLKQSYRTLENELFFTEKISSIAALKGAIEYPTEELKSVTEDMINVEFHDVLSGTTIKAGEDNAIRNINHGLYTLNNLRAKAFFGLIKGERVADPNTYPFFVFNPKAHNEEQYVEAETCLVIDKVLKDDDFAWIDIYDEEGNLIPSQTIKEESNISFQWRKRFIFKGKFNPLGITRFNAKWHIVSKKDLKKPVNKDLVFENDKKYIKISAKTGLIESYKVNGKEYAKGPLFQPFMYEDYEDPWGMKYNNVGHDPVVFEKMEKMHGMFDTLKSFEVREDGDIFVEAESFFELKDSQIRIQYRVYKDGDEVDVLVDVFPGDMNKAFKLHLPLSGHDFSGEQMFGYEKLSEEGDECVAHNFLTLRQDDGCFIEVITPSTYGSSYKDGTMIITLLRTASYCAHPIQDNPIVPENMFIKKIDAGQRTFSFRLTTAKEEELAYKADLFIEKPYCLNIFPTIDKRKDNGFKININNKNISVITVKKSLQKDGYVMRLQNNSSLNEECVVNLGDNSIALKFGKYEVKTIVFDNNNIEETVEMYI